jgi:NosR/NirI family nitrous oxide reductase transcriptional regulator
MLRAQKFLALCGRPWLAAMLVWLAVLVAVVPQAWAERLPEFLAKTPVAEIFPGADAYGAPEGKPVVARALKGGEPLGYVYLTTDVVNTRGYSSKPIDILVGIAQRRHHCGRQAGGAPRADCVDRHSAIQGR